MRMTLLVLSVSLAGCYTTGEGDDGEVQPPPRIRDLCNGVDDDNNPGTLDGVDEPAIGQPCDGPDGDVCSQGSIVCMGGTLVCNESPQGKAEACNGRDDDCDGKVDEDYDLTTDAANCGFCGHECQNPNGPLACAASVCTPTCAVGAEDCDGDPDNGCEVFRDRNPTCNDTIDIGAVSGDAGVEVLDYEGTDEMILRATLREDSTGDIPITGTIDLDTPPGVNFDLYVSCQSCGGGTMGSSLHDAGIRDTVPFRHEDTYNTNDNQVVFIEVRFVDANTCGPWHLTIHGHTDVASATCGDPL